MSYSLGIDLGTTFVTAAIATESTVKMFTLGKGSVAIPAVVYLHSDGTLTSGEDAGGGDVENPGENDPDRIARELMSRLGDPTPVFLGGEPHEVIDLVGILVRDVAHMTTKTQGKPPEHVVLTYPAGWGPFRRALLDKAARQAGLRKPTIVTEPEAAAAHHFSTRPWNDGDPVAVYDLGGNTFNATVLRKQGGKVEILGTPERIENLGGNGFDSAIAAHVDQDIGGALRRLDRHRSQTVVTLTAVWQDCVRAKETLSTSTRADFPVFLPSQRCDVHLTRSEFEGMARGPIASTVAALSRTLQSAEVKPADLSAVLLVGGSSAIPLVARMVTEELGRPVTVDPHPHHVIALGAAKLAAQAAHHDESDLAGTLQGGRHYRKLQDEGHTGRQGPASRTVAPAPAVTAVTTAPSKPAVQPLIPAVQGSARTIPVQRTGARAPAATSPGNSGNGTAVPPVDPPPQPRTPPPDSPSPPAGTSPEARRPGPVVKRRTSGALTDRVRQPRVLVGSGAAIVLTGLVIVTIFNGGKEASTPSALTHPAKSEPSAAAVAGPAVPVPAAPGPAVPAPAAPAPAAPAPAAPGPAAAMPTVDATIRIGATPSFVAVAPDGARAYVANGDAQNITVLDTANNRTISTIPIATGPPQFLTFAPDGRTLYITVSNTQGTIHAIDVLDVASNTVTATIPQSGMPLRPAVTPDGRRLFVANHDIPSVSVIDTTTRTVIGQVAVAPNPHWVAFSPDGSRAYAANHESDLVSVIDTSTLGVLRTISVGSSPHSIAVNPHRPIVANVNYDGRSVSEIDTATNRVVATIPVGQNPQDIAWAPDGRFAYVVNVSSNTVSVIDATTNQVTATIPTGDGPTSIAVRPDGRQAFVSNQDAGTVTVLKLPR